MNPLDAYLPFGLTVESLLAYAIGLVTFASVMAAWRALLEHRPTAARVRAITQRRQELQAAATSVERRRQRAQLPPGLVPLLVRRLHRLQASQIERIRDKMMRAGFRSREAVGIYAGAKLAGPTLVVRCRQKIPAGQEPSAAPIRLPELGRGYQPSASHH